MEGHSLRWSNVSTGNPAAVTDRPLRPKVSQTGLVPPNLTRSCSSMRLMKKSTLSYFLKALDFFFTDSSGLLPNSTTLVKTQSGQLFSKKPRIELELPRHNDTDIDSLRYYGELLIPYEGNSHSSEESENSTPFDPADDV
jgi:hypothetical protein